MALRPWLKVDEYLRNYEMRDGKLRHRRAGGAPSAPGAAAPLCPSLAVCSPLALRQSAGRMAAAAKKKNPSGAKSGALPRLALAPAPGRRRRRTAARATRCVEGAA